LKDEADQHVFSPPPAGASEINISCVIEERDADRALNIIHTSMFTFLD
jgi:aspartokinase